MIGEHRLTSHAAATGYAGVSPGSLRRPTSSLGVCGKVELRDGDRMPSDPFLLVDHASTSGISTETISHTVVDG
jgi:hypothetical protein